MASLIIVTAALLLSRAKRTLAAQSPLAAPASGFSFSKECIQLDIPLRINAKNHRYAYPRVDSNIDAVDWVWNLTTWSHGTPADHITGVIPINDTFTISTQLCVPPQGAKSDILQLATHGIGFDKR